MRAARINTEEVDENSVIILEDLRYEGYQNMDKLKGFNLEETKSLLIDIATFHAVPLAIKHSNSLLFQTKIKNNCIDPLPLPKPTDGENNTPPPFPFELLREVLEESEFCKANLDKFEQIVKKTKEETQPIVFFKRKDPNGKFSTLCHNDMWINNILQTIEEPKKNKLLDFQIYTIDNLALDLVYFLFTSVNSKVLQRNFDYLLRFYYDNFVKILKPLKCTENYFQYDSFIEKVKEAAVDKFIHIGSMTMIASKSKKNENGGDVHTGAKEKFVFLFTEMVKRKWI
ncbi:unnamed protein product [Diabrotica balteata]|uniref:CHK kinase-like domain-containing protein n=1 Tax=Diabrotica balteata TaxID=107213 RepID=A0A9N9T3I0_DIABA|nr:unnamed protein product [Diabrotica balteata]